MKVERDNDRPTEDHEAKCGCCGGPLDFEDTDYCDHCKAAPQDPGLPIDYLNEFGPIDPE